MPHIQHSRPVLDHFSCINQRRDCYTILKELETGSISNTQGIGDAIDIQCSRNRRRDRYPILKESETRSISNTQQTEIRSIFDTQQQSCERVGWSDASDTQGLDHVINIWYSTDRVVIDRRWLDLIDTQGIIRDAVVIPYSTNRDVIDIQYCLTEGKLLDDGQINLQ